MVVGVMVVARATVVWASACVTAPFAVSPELACIVGEGDAVFADGLGSVGG